MWPISILWEFALQIAFCLVYPAYNDGVKTCRNCSCQK